MSVQVVDVAIIGAGEYTLNLVPRAEHNLLTVSITGWYGLAAAKTYLTLQPTANVLIIDDDSSVGGVWSQKRLYPNLYAQVKLGVSGSLDPRD